MSSFSNDSDGCLVCGVEYDMLHEISDTSMLQTQGKANMCVAHKQDATFVFVHFQEKYL